MKIKTADLTAARDGSYYTITGAGGDLSEWVAGYEKALAEAGIGQPVAWYRTTGAKVNEFRRRTAGGGEVHPSDAFADDLTVLMFPLDGLLITKLPLFKVEWQDRWFDDILQNMRMIEVVS